MAKAEQVKTKDENPGQKYTKYYSKQKDISCWNCAWFQPISEKSTYKGYCREQSVPSAITSVYKGTSCGGPIDMFPETEYAIGQTSIADSENYWCKRWARSTTVLAPPIQPS